MKTLFVIFATLLTLELSAQNFKLTDRSVVKDSSGTVYPAAAWQALYMKGEYDLKAENPKDANTAFILVRLSEQEKEARLKRMPKPRESDFFETGKKLAPFNAKDIEGNDIDLSSAKGKIVVLNFWFINCGPCRREIPELNVLVDSFKKNENVLFVAVALDSKAALQKFLEKTPFHYSVIEGRSIAGNYGVRLYPTHVILDTEGKVYFHTSGLAMNTVYWIKKSIKELLAKAEKG
jgi:thiol-disulfide isomerase/thioredoxin